MRLRSSGSLDVGVFAGALWGTLAVAVLAVAALLAAAGFEVDELDA